MLLLFLSLTALALGQMCEIITLNKETLPNVCEITTIERQVEYNTSSHGLCQIILEQLKRDPLAATINISELEPDCAHAFVEEACESEVNAYTCSGLCAPCEPCGDYMRDLLTNCPKTVALCRLNLTSTNLPACTGPKFVGLPIKQRKDSTTTTSSSSTVTARLWCSVMLAGLVQRATSIHA